MCVALMLLKAMAGNVIVFTDFYSDTGDASAITDQNNFNNLGLDTFKAVLVDVTDTNSALSVSSVNTYFGNTNVPVGIYTNNPAIFPPGSAPFWVVHLNLDLAHSQNTFSGAVAVARTALAACPDHSVVIKMIGFGNNFANLLRSGADAITNRTGWQLVSNKVSKVVAFVGDYPDSSQVPGGGAEFNAAQTPADWGYISSNCPVSIVYLGFSLANTLGEGTLLPTVDANYPTALAFSLDGITTNKPWDDMPILYGYTGTNITAPNFYATEVTGTNFFDSITGSNWFVSAIGAPQSYVVTHGTSAFQNDYFDHLQIMTNSGQAAALNLMHILRYVGAYR